MSSLNWIRLSALAAMLGGMLWAGVWAHHASLPVVPPGEIGRAGGWNFNILAMVFLSLIMVGLTGAYFQQAKRMGLIGKAGLALPWIGLALMGIGRYGQFSHATIMIGAGTAFTGFALFGLATLRAKVLPRAAATLLIVGALLLFLTKTQDRRAFLAVPLGLAWVWLGYAGWREGGVTGRETDAGHS